MIKYLAGCLLLIAGLYISSCTKEDDYKKFSKDGEITYPGRVDSVIVQSGNERVQLQIALGTDPAVTKVRAYWNDRADSAELAVDRSDGRDTVNMIIDNLPAGQYNFNVYTYDNKNHVSVVKNASGTVYDDNYLKALSNRAVRSVGLSTEGWAVINWGEPLAGEVGIELKYTDYSGANISVIVPGSQVVTELPSYTDESVLSYRSLFLPEADAVDTFSLGYEQVTLPVFERQMAKEDFEILILPTDIPEGGYGWLMDYLWNENYDTPGFATQDSDSQWFTFDMGSSAKLNRFKTWQANDRLYNDQNAKKFEVWGSNDPNADGNWDSWTKLMTCESVKPSGLPLGEVSDADIVYAKAGEEFVFPEDIPSIRYIRIKVLETWGSGTFITMAELTFWTRER